MRILQACPYSWDMHGGVQAHVRLLSTRLERLGHQVIVLAPGLTPPADPRVRIVGRPCHLRFNGSMTSVCLNPRSLLAIRAALREFRPDVVHVHEPLCPGVPMAVTLVARAPIVATFHAYYPPSPASLLYAIEARLVWPVWRRIDLGLAVSKAAAACIEARTSLAVRVVPNGVETGGTGSREPGGAERSGRRLLFVGRLDRRKGFPVLVEAFARLAGRYPDLELFAVGDGPTRVVVDRLPADLRLRVHMRGTCRDEELIDHYTGADLFVAPALGRESFGIVLLEAMAAGLPVVASDIPGYREVVRHGSEALLVAPGQPAVLAAAIAQVLDDPHLARRLGHGGRLRASAFSWERVAVQIDEAYAEARLRAGASVGTGRLLRLESIRRFIPRW